MAWSETGQNLSMAEGDFGIKLPITVSGITFSQSDEILLVIKTKINGEDVLTKTFSNIIENTIDLELTEAESALLAVGTYVYRLDWYQNGAFLCNIIPTAEFKVVDKA